MSDDLVKRLRGFPPNIHETMTEAADRIAALEAAVTQCRTLSAMLKPQADRIAELEAALATARRDGGMKDGEPSSEDIIRADRDAWPDHQAAAIRAAAKEVRPGEYLSEAEQERDEFFNRLGRITDYLDIHVDVTAQRIIEAIQERVDNEREACASVEVRVNVPEGAESWTPLEAWEEAIIAFNEAFRAAIRAALEGGKK